MRRRARIGPRAQPGLDAAGAAPGRPATPQAASRPPGRRPIRPLFSCRPAARPPSAAPLPPVRRGHGFPRPHGPAEHEVNGSWLKLRCRADASPSRATWIDCRRCRMRGRKNAERTQQPQGSGDFSADRARRTRRSRRQPEPCDMDRSPPDAPGATCQTTPRAAGIRGISARGARKAGGAHTALMPRLRPGGERDDGAGAQALIPPARRARS
jgi:hypothetical protein